jgi:hypothetical protein
MKRYILKIFVENAGTYFRHKRDVVTLLSKEKIIEHFDKQYEKHKKNGTVTISVEMELSCGEIFEVL